MPQPTAKLPTKKLIRKGPWAREALQVIFDLTHWAGQGLTSKTHADFRSFLFELAESLHGRVALESPTRVIFLIFPENGIEFLEQVWNQWQPKSDTSSPEAPVAGGPTLRILVDQNSLNFALLKRIYRDISTFQPEALENIIFLTESAREKLSKKAIIPSFSRLHPKLTKIFPSAYIPTASPIANSPLVAHAISESDKRGLYLAEIEKGFFGRSLEVASLQTYLKSGNVVVVTAPGGTGKTRLVLEVISQVRPRFDQGIATVDLTATSDPESIPNMLLAALGLSARVSMSPLESAIYALRGSSMLILFDNCEQVQEASSFILDQLHKSCPNLCIVATSRIPLNIKGESEIRLDPLPVPRTDSVFDSRSLEIFPAARLLAERITIYKPLFRVNSWNWSDFVTLCRQTKGNPLAIEVAASKVKHTSLRNLAIQAQEGLEDLPAEASGSVDSEATPVEDAFTYALESLDANARGALKDLAVLGSFFNEEIIRVPFTNHGIAKTRVSRILNRWKNRALLAEIEVDGVVFYRISTPLREFILSSLTEDEIEESRESQTEGLTKIVVVWKEWWDDSPEAETYYRKWEPVLPILERTLLSSIKAESKFANDVAVKIMPFYIRRGRYQEGLALAKSLMGMHNHRKHPQQRVYPILISINLLAIIGNAKSLRQYVDRALLLSRQVDLGAYSMIMYNVLEAMIRYAWFEDAQKEAELYLQKLEKGKVIEKTGIMTMLGHLNLELGNLDQSQKFFTRARLLNSHQGNVYNLCDIESGLAFIAVKESEWSKAIHIALLGLKRVLSLGNQDMFSILLLPVAIASFRLGHIEAAAEALAHFEKVLARTRGIVYPVYRERYRSIRLETVTALGQEGYAQICATNLSPEDLIKKLQAQFVS